MMISLFLMLLFLLEAVKTSGGLEESNTPVIPLPPQYRTPPPSPILSREERASIVQFARQTFRNHLDSVTDPWSITEVQFIRISSFDWSID